MYTATSVATGPAQGSKMRRLDRDVRGEENVCLLSHRTVPTRGVGTFFVKTAKIV